MEGSEIGIKVLVVWFSGFLNLLSIVEDEDVVSIFV